MGWVRSHVPFLAPVTNAIGDVAGAVGNVVSDVASTAGNAISDIAQSPLVGIGLGLAFPGIGTAIGEAIGLTGAAAAAAGGAILGGGTAAAGGGNVLQGALLGGAGGALFSGAPGDMTVPTEAPGLPSSFDQYLAPTQTSLSSIANTGAISYPVPDQIPFTGTSILDPLNGAPVTSPTDYSLGGSNVQGMGGAQGIQVSPNTNLSDMGGGQGITNATSANLSDMGGAQGITTGASGGGVLGATGVNTGGSVLGVNPLTGQTLGTALNTLNPGVTNPQISTTGGLPLTNDLTGGTLGAGVAGIDTGIGAGLVGAGAASAAGAGAGAAGAGGFGTGLTPAQIIALGSGVAGLAGGINTNSAISDAQAIQNAAAAKSAGTLGDIYSTQMASLAPYQATGQAGLTDINANMPYFQHQFDTADLNSNLAPNYAFQLGQGQQANQRAANVGGGALSGNTLTGLNRYTQDYAGNAYQQAFNNYNTQRNNIYNTLSGIAGLGTTANAQGISAGGTYGTNLTNLNTGIAAAQAGATVGQAQNTSNTISNLGNTAVLASLLGQKNTVTG